MPPLLTTWSGSLHLSYRLLPVSAHLVAFLDSPHGSPWEAVFERMPFDRARSEHEEADPRRYRDAKQLYETCGLLFQADGCVWFTEFGLAVKRFRPMLNEANRILLARHAALALSACQLRNPTEAGQKYDPSMQVFPNKYIWRAMLELGGRVSSDELNRAVFRVRNEAELEEAIGRIRHFRANGNAGDLGAETISGSRKNDRIIPVVSVAGFGWSLIMDKEESLTPGYYHVRPGYERLLEAAIAIPWPHEEFGSVEGYMKRISEAAFLPRDLR